MTTYVLAGSHKIATDELRKHGFQEISDRMRNGSYFTNVIWIGPQTHILEGRNILKGDKVLFGYGTTVNMIETFMAQCWSRGTQLSDLEIIHD